jgi:signal transduction histidine kinase
MPDVPQTRFTLELFLPEGHGNLWQTGLVWLHPLSDILLALAYGAIAAALIYIVGRRQPSPFRGLILLVGALMIACGGSHLVAAWPIWQPSGWLSGTLKALTALVSVYAMLEVFRWLPNAIALPSLADTSEKLEHEISERSLAEAAQQRYAQRVEGINTISRAILAQQSTRETAQVALLHLRRLVPCQWAAVALFDFSRDQAEVIAGDTEGDAFLPAGLCLPLDHFSVLDHLGQGTVFHVADIATLDHPSLIMQRLLHSGIRCCMVVPLFLEGQLIGELKLADTHTPAFTPEHEEIAKEVADLLALTLQKARMLEQAQIDRERLHTLSAQLINAQETERRHIARELHDEIGQALTIVKINLQSLQPFAVAGADRPTPPQVAQTALQDSLNTVDVALRQVRDLSLNLRPSILDDLGLVAALRWYVDRYSQRTGLTTAFRVTGSLPPLPANVATACFRIVQEALTNVARHAQAQRVTVALKPQAEALHLLIEDDGIGFDVEAARVHALQGSSLGLLGMEERARLVEGHLALHSTPASGTQIHVHIPLAGSALAPAPAERGRE